MAIGASIVAALGIGAALGASTQNSTAAPAPAPSASTEPNPLAELVRREDGDPLAIGDIDAPVVVIEYADFTCKYCGVFAENTLPALMEEYVDAGHVRIEWRDAPVLSDHSITTAIAARAAAEQGLFWEFYELLYAHTYAEVGDYSRETLVGLAGTVNGLDVDAFTAALDAPELAEAVRQEGAQSRAIGVTATPTFVVGDQVIQGAQPIETFRQIIDKQLRAAG